MAESAFKFHVIKRTSYPPDVATSCAYLREDNWDDWFQFSTMYDLIVFDGTGNRYELGAVKIGQLNGGRPATAGLAEIIRST